MRTAPGTGGVGLRSIRNTLGKMGVAVGLCMVLAACGLFSSDIPPPPRNKTQEILFLCDQRINSGMQLPVELIYIRADEDPKQVVDIGPDAWFDSEEREKWPYKETFLLQGGHEYRLRLEKPPETTAVVIFFSFYQVDERDHQQVILETDAAEEAVIWVGADRVYH